MERIYRKVPLWGGVIGGALGAISGGLNAYYSDKNILTGGYTNAQKNFARSALLNNGIDTNASYPATEFALNDFTNKTPELAQLNIDSKFPKLKVGRSWNLPRGHSLSRQLIRDPTGNLAGGLTNPLSANGNCAGCLGSEIYIAPKQFTKAYKLFLSLGHEFNHAKDFAIGNMSRWVTAFTYAGHHMNANQLAIWRSEVSAHTWSYNWASQLNYRASHYSNMINHYSNLLPFLPN